MCYLSLASVLVFLEVVFVKLVKNLTEKKEASEESKISKHVIKLYSLPSWNPQYENQCSLGSVEGNVNVKCMVANKF